MKLHRTDFHDTRLGRRTEIDVDKDAPNREEIPESIRQLTFGMFECSSRECASARETQILTKKKGLVEVAVVGHTSSHTPLAVRRQSATAQHEAVELPNTGVV